MAYINCKKVKTYTLDSTAYPARIYTVGKNDICAIKYNPETDLIFIDYKKPNKDTSDKPSLYIRANNFILETIN